MHRESKLSKVGNSPGGVLPNEVPAHLHAQRRVTPSMIGADDGTLRVSPNQPEVARQLVVAQDVMHRYRNTLRELAK